MNYEEILQRILDKNGNISGNKLKFIDDLSKTRIIKATSFLDTSASLRERVYCISNNITEYKTCGKCSNYVRNFINGKYSKYCSLLCSNSSDAVKEKRKSKYMENYGVDNPSKSELIKNKIKETNTLIYGVDNPAKSEQVKKTISDNIRRTLDARSDEILKRRKNTCIKKYGVDSFSKTEEFIIKSNSTNIEKFGEIWASSSPLVKSRIKSTYMENYGVDNPFKSELIKNKIKETNIRVYGVDNPSKSEHIRNKKIATQIEKYGTEHFNQRHISDSTMKLLQNKDALLKFCMDTPDSYLKLGIDKNTLYRYLEKYDIKDYVVSKHMSAMETHLLSSITKHGFTVFANRRDIIPPLELDLYIPDLKIAIECNGAFWHSERQGKDRNYHLNKMLRCEELGIQLLHIFDYEYSNFYDIVMERLYAKLGVNFNTTYARKTEVVEVNPRDEKVFLNNTHIQQYAKSSLCFGLMHNNKLVALMSFVKSRFNSDSEWELLRYSSIGRCIGGMSKLFSHFVRNISPVSVITYADRNWNSGNSYSRLGFVHTHNSSPNYFYTKDYRTIESRLKYQKHKLKDLLPVFDNNLSEWENMYNNGYDRIWNCGNKVFKWAPNEV